MPNTCQMTSVKHLTPVENVCTIAFIKLNNLTTLNFVIGNSPLNIYIYIIFNIVVVANWKCYKLTNSEYALCNIWMNANISNYIFHWAEKKAEHAPRRRLFSTLNLAIKWWPKSEIKNSSNTKYTHKKET